MRMKKTGTREAILKERAVKIGRAPDRAEAAGERLEVVEFLLMSERFAVESKYVQRSARSRRSPSFRAFPPSLPGS
jgi:hypothetical protein